MHAYRSHTCADLTAANVGETVRLSGWVHRVRDHGGVLFIDLRDHYGITQVLCDPDSPVFAEVEKVRSEWCIRIDGEVKARDAEPGEPEAADRRDRGLHPRHRSAGRGGRTAADGVRRSGIPRGNPPALSLPRPAPRGDAGQHEAALRRGGIDAQAHVGQGLPRIPDADHHRLVARGRARLPGAVAPASGQVLRAAAGAAAVQAAADGLGLRQVFPDRALFPRRRPARRPLAHRFLPARHGDELRRAAGRVRHDPAGAGRACSRNSAAAAKVDARTGRRSPTAMRRCGTAPTSPTCATRSRCRSCPSISAGSGFAIFAKLLEQEGTEVRAIPAPGRRVAQVLRPDERLCPEGGPAGDGLYLLAGQARTGWKPPARWPRTSAPSAPRRSASSLALAWAMRPSSLAASPRPSRRSRAGAHRDRRGAGPDRQGPLRLCLDRRFPDLREGRGNRPDRFRAQPVLDAAGRDGGAGRAIRSRCWATSTIWPATATSWSRARSATTSPRSCSRPSRSPATARTRCASASAAWSTPSTTARRRTAAVRRGSTGS